MLWRSLKYHAVELYMKFEEIPLPREKDRLVMEIINERISSEAATRSLNRCRCYLSALFLSDITTADGKYLEQLAMIPSENGTKSRYKFSREVPTQAVWKRWQRFWTDYTTTGKRLPVELGRWINPTPEHGDGFISRTQMTCNDWIRTNYITTNVGKAEREGQHHMM